MRRINTILFFAIFLFVIDYYVFQAVSVAFGGFAPQARQVIFGFYWGVTGLTVIGLLVYYLGNADRLPKRVKTYILVGIATNFIAKTFVVLVLFLEDVQRAVRWAYLRLSQLFGESSGTGCRRGSHRPLPIVVSGCFDHWQYTGGGDQLGYYQRCP